MVAEETKWWVDAVVYSLYPRSFRDASGDGVGDLLGIQASLDSLVDLGVDAIWLTPVMRSPQHDGGYDVSDYRDIDPLFGTLDHFDSLLESVHERGLKLLMDITPNHASTEHPWFKSALGSTPGSTQRERFFFRDGRGANGEEPPNNWQSHFGGPAWTRVTEADGRPGQWYLHLFDSTQPDFNWENPDVRAEFRSILRFWFDRGVDGFRVDSAQTVAKAAGLPDASQRPDGRLDQSVFSGRDEVHEIWREWRDVANEYSDRLLTAEAWVGPPSRIAQWARPDEMHAAFNFAYFVTEFAPHPLHQNITESLDAFSAVGAPVNWVQGNHDTARLATRMALPHPFSHGQGIGPHSPNRPQDPERGLRRARASSLLMLALPGSAYIYQGDELGLPEAIDLPDEARQDPMWIRSQGEVYGRDGSRVPLPWTHDAPSFGFSSAGLSWLPQPSDWAELARDRQEAHEESTLSMYRRALRVRRKYSLGTSDVHSLEASERALTMHVGDVLVVTNFTDGPIPLPEPLVALVSSSPAGTRADGAPAQSTPGHSTVWYLKPHHSEH